MDTRMRIFIGIVMVLAIIYIIRTIRQKQIDIRHALIWLLMGVILLVLDIFPSLLEGLSRLLGFVLPVNMLFFLGFALAILIIFDLTGKVSRLADQIKSLTQEHALLAKRIEELEGEKEATEAERR